MKRLSIYIQNFNLMDLCLNIQLQPNFFLFETFFSKTQTFGRDDWDRLGLPR